jgi:thiol-disulfide isomerase/thioredoxin
LQRRIKTNNNLLQQLLKKNLSSIILLAVLAVLLFSPNAKALLLKALLGTGVFNASTAKETDAGKAALVPPILFAGIDGQAINTAELHGKVVFINFWASWCPPCIAEMGSINALYSKLKSDSRFVFILVDADGHLPAATAFMAKHGYDLRVYSSAGPVSGDLYSGSLPTTLIIDTNGNLVQKHEGIANYDTRNMEQFMRSLALTAVR